MGVGTVAHLRLPPEDELPSFGSGCCVLAPDDAIRTELDGWRDVRTLHGTSPSARLPIELGPQAPPPTELIAALHGIGIEAEPDTQCCESP